MVFGIGEVLRQVVGDVQEPRAGDPADRAPHHQRRGVLALVAAALEIVRDREVAGNKAERHHQTVAVDGERADREQNRKHLAQAI